MSNANLSIWDQACQRLVLQHWPASALYVVATPIGNLADLTLRAWYALQTADIIAAEDTRATRILLQSWGIDTNLISLHRHNEQARLETILERLSQGQRVALVSDAGAPGVSDPGGHLIQAVRQHGHPIVALPGASAIIATLMSFGTTTDEHPEFAFLGFLATRSAQRQRQLQPWKSYEGTLLCFEAPHRLEGSLQDLQTVFGGERRIGIARELTKRFEETSLMPLSQGQEWLRANAHRQQGEYVLLIAPESRSAHARAEDVDLVNAETLPWIEALLTTHSARDVAKLMATILSQPRDRCYAWLHEHLARNGGHDA